MTTKTQINENDLLFALVDENETDDEQSFTFDGVPQLLPKPDIMGRIKKPKVLVAKAEVPTDFTKALAGETTNATGKKVHITPYVPQRSVRKQRERSTATLDRVRVQRFSDTGMPPRLVVESTTGLLLPRDQVVDPRKPVIKVGADGKEFIVEVKLTDERPTDNRSTEVVHYKRSVDVVAEIRDARLIKKFVQL